MVPNKDLQVPLYLYSYFGQCYVVAGFDQNRSLLGNGCDLTLAWKL